MVGRLACFGLKRTGTDLDFLTAYHYDKQSEASCPEDRIDRIVCVVVPERILIFWDQTQYKWLGMLEGPQQLFLKRVARIKGILFICTISLFCP